MPRGDLWTLHSWVESVFFVVSSCLGVVTRSFVMALVFRSSLSFFRAPFFSWHRSSILPVWMWCAAGVKKLSALSALRRSNDFLGACANFFWGGCLNSAARPRLKCLLAPDISEQSRGFSAHSSAGPPQTTAQRICVFTHHSNSVTKTTCSFSKPRAHALLLVPRARSWSATSK